jgi:hypothetical protein
MMNFSDVRSILESLSDLAKKTATLDLQEKIVNLREYIISLKDENISLKEKNQELKLQLEARQDLNLKDGLLWKKNDSVPFCHKCFEDQRKQIHLQRWGDGWKCLKCDNYFDPSDQSGRARIFPSEPIDYI